VQVERTLDVRYAGQSYEVQVPYARGWRAAFHRRHRRLFGHADPARPVEVVVVRVRARGGATVPPRDVVAGARGTGRPVRRPVWFAGRRHAAAVLRRDRLGRGFSTRGPALVCEYSATTVVPPGWRLRVDAVGGLVLAWGRHA
jgi:N-methylhydantoinase A